MLTAGLSIGRKITGKFDANKLAQAGFDYDANLKYST